MALLGMRIFEVSCNACGSAYNVAESGTIHGEESEYSCTVCGATLIKLTSHHYRVCRMVAAAEHPYFHVPGDAPEPVVNT